MRYGSNTGSGTYHGRRSFMKKRMVFLLAVLCVFLTACASSVQRRPDGVGYRYGGEKFNKVELTVDPAATQDPNDIVRFENQKLQSIIERNLAEIKGDSAAGK